MSDEDRIARVALALCVADGEDPEKAGKPQPKAVKREMPPAEAEGSTAEMPGVSPVPFAKPAPKKHGRK